MTKGEAGILKVDVTDNTGSIQKNENGKLGKFMMIFYSVINLDFPELTMIAISYIFESHLKMNP